MKSFALIGRLLRALPPEAAHRLTIRALAAGLGPRRRRITTSLSATVFGLEFPNPLGLAAGFDKDAEVVGPALDLGFGFVETGSITPRPQPGNPKPRMFRLTADQAVINRLGFGGRGMEAAAERLAAFRRRDATALVGINIGKNRETEDAAADYAAVARRLAPYASYLVINVSSPNTPGLRALQGKDELARLVDAVRDAVGDPAPPVVVKIAPDLEADDRAAVAAVTQEAEIDGLIIGNTTVSRPPGLTDPARGEEGGLSGRPLMPLSTAVLSDMYVRTAGRIPLIGLGGVASGGDAYVKIRAGASLVQLYTALVYQGPDLVPAILEALAERLAADGFSTIYEAIGADHR
ncbi:MAG: quinone-dependent dihydroorotate dehydrogenase [Alphaproteobacteria bacterium]|nr:quinone-dependent dihydroorotate dehydrogenase [Alphaproteobacteria bacterium]